MNKTPQLVFQIAEIDDKKIIRQLGGAKDKAEAVMRKSVNRTATHLVKPIKEEALKNYAVTNIRKKDIQKTLKVYKAKKGRRFLQESCRLHIAGCRCIVLRQAGEHLLRKILQNPFQQEF